MQPTADLWATLCQDLHGRRQCVAEGEYARIAGEFVESAQQMLRAGSPRLRDAFEIAGDICAEAALAGQAMDYYRQAAEQPVHDPAAGGRIAAKLAQLAEGEGDWTVAALWYEQALDLLDRAGDHSQHPSLFNALASARKASGDFPAAEAAYRRAIQQTLDLHGAQHPDVATYMTNLGVEMTEVRRYDEAEDLLLQGLALREHIYGANHPEIAHSLTNLGVVHHSRGDRSRAREYYEAAVKIYERFRPADCPEILHLQQNLQRLGPR